MQRKPKTILFDLDDTLFDHRHSARTAIAAVARKYSWNTRSIEELEAEYDRLLSEIHPAVLAGKVTPEQSRRMRYARLFEFCQAPHDDRVIGEALAFAMGMYRDARKAVDGAAELLIELKQQYKIGVISNNFLNEQMEKLDVIGLRKLVDELVVSEEVGYTKPDKRIFEVAMSRMDAGPCECLMIGDSWEADIVGATNAGIRAIWFNRFGLPCPNGSAVLQCHAFSPASVVRTMIEEQLNRD